MLVIIYVIDYFRMTEVFYFIAKCIRMQSLKECQKTHSWACTDRADGPQPRSLLTDAFNKGQVILIFSVNNCHGWHGYATMKSIPGTSFIV